MWGGEGQHKVLFPHDFIMKNASHEDTPILSPLIWEQPQLISTGPSSEETWLGFHREYLNKIGLLKTSNITMYEYYA